MDIVVSPTTLKKQQLKFLNEVKVLLYGRFNKIHTCLSNNIVPMEDEDEDEDDKNTTWSDSEDVFGEVSTPEPESKKSAWSFWGGKKNKTKNKRKYKRGKKKQTKKRK